MAGVTLQHISKKFDHDAVGLEDFSLEVRDKEFVTILGPSGSGKSTALRIIAGLETQDSGNVLLDGVNVNDLPTQKRDCAFVFQSYALYPHLDVEENIAVGLRLQGYAAGEIQKRVREVAALLEIGAFLKRRPKALSGGQRQRVALARAIAKRPKVFLLDEPLSNLDAILREKMRSELKILFRKIGGTVIYVTHDQAEAMSLSDRIALIDKGRLRQSDVPDALYYRPQDLFVASFMGTPRINTFEVAVEKKEFVCGDERWPIPQACIPKTNRRQRLILGVRPEDIRVYLKPEPDTFPAEFLVMERMGTYAVLSLHWHGQVLKASVEKDLADRITKDREGDRREDKGGAGKQVESQLWIRLNPSKLYFFDIDTQHCI